MLLVVDVPRRAARRKVRGLDLAAIVSEVAGKTLRSEVAPATRVVLWRAEGGQRGHHHVEWRVVEHGRREAILGRVREDAVLRRMVAVVRPDLRHVTCVDRERVGHGRDRVPLVAVAHLQRVAVHVLREHRQEARVPVWRDAERRRVGVLGAWREPVHPQVGRVPPPQQLREEAARHPKAERHHARNLVCQVGERVEVGGDDGAEAGEHFGGREAVETVQVGGAHVAVG
mmetsp:Transcript_30695/g.59188  ORF Transcript_30695/g.59188 Transcript_30695/m.59188 type:complete len:229 (-) Transcript_30695:653-1339(-)